MSVVPQPINHFAFAKSLLPAQYRGKTNWTKLLKVISRPFQDLEDAFQDLLLLRSISTATGVQLDIIGELLNLRRFGKTDDAYRIRLRARVLLIKSSGTQPQILAIMKAVFSTNAYRYRAWYPAAFTIESIGATATADAQELADLLALAKAAGVRANLTYSTAAEASTFTWNGTAAQGWNAGEWAHTAEGE